MVSLAVQSSPGNSPESKMSRVHFSWTLNEKSPRSGRCFVVHHIDCAEIWGGVRGEDVDACTSGVVASLYSSAAEGGKGGDVYYISSCDGDAVTRVAIADVMGHGEVVSDISQWLYDALRIRINDLESNGVLAELNTLAEGRGYKAMTTAAVVTFSGADSNLYFSYAGHPPIFAYRHNDKRWEAVTLESQGKQANLPLGVLMDTPYDQELRSLATGDRLFLYSDGVTEAPDREGEQFGMDRLQAVLETAADGTPRDLKKAVLSALCRHTGGSLAHDDVTFMVLEVR